MRRLAFILLVLAAVAAPVAAAAHRTPGDGTVAGRDVNGTVAIFGHGAIWGVVTGGNASIQVTDSDPTDGTVKVSGWDSRTVPSAPSSTTVYTLNPGSTASMRFALVSGGDYRLVIKGADISFSAVGGGRVKLDGSDTADSTGKYQVGDAPWQPVPTVSTLFSFPAP
jgi:hypothetical protein